MLVVILLILLVGKEHFKGVFLGRIVMVVPVVVVIMAVRAEVIAKQIPWVVVVVVHRIILRH
jgi:hypothetical protein